MMSPMEEAEILLACWKDKVVAHECSRRRKRRKVKKKVSELERKLASTRLVEAGRDQERLVHVLACRGAMFKDRNRGKSRPVPIGARQSRPVFQEKKKVWADGRRECREQNKPTGLCVVGPQESCVDYWSQDWITLHNIEEDMQKFEETERDTQNKLQMAAVVDLECLFRCHVCSGPDRT